MSSQLYNGVKVAFLHYGLEGGGSERVSLTTAQRMAQWGIESHFIAPHHKDKEFVLPPGLNAKITLLPNKRSFCESDNKEWLLNYFAEQDIRIAFVCYIASNFFQDFHPSNGCQMVYWLHVNPFWQIEQAKETGEIGARYSIKRWIEWHLKGGKRRAYAPQRREEVKEFYRKELSLFDRYIVLHPHYKQDLVRTLQLTSQQAEKIVPILNTIDLVEQPNLNKSKVIAFVARVSLVQKRFDRMLEIWKRVSHKLPDWELHYYGAGPDQWILDRMLKKKPLERFKLCGYETDLDKIYKDAAVVALSSTYEGWGLVFTEGQTRGAIPITFACNSAMGAIIGEEAGAGILIPPFDIDEYAEQLVSLCLDEAKRKEMQRRSLEHSRQFAHHVNDNTWLQLLSELLPTPSSKAGS